MAMAAFEDLELRFEDITSAFTNGDLDEEIYMKQPEGFNIGGPNKVCRLRKSLYCLKQYARQLDKKLHSVLTELVFKRIESGRSDYIYFNGEVCIIFPIYVDNITLVTKSPAAIDKYAQLLSQHFKCCDLGATRGWPTDIAYSVAYLAHFNANLGPAHWNALKHLFRYIKGTFDHKLTYHGNLAGCEPFITYTDASHGDCVDTGHSTADFVTMITGGAIGWYSKLQTIVVLSTTEAEYMAAIEGGKEIALMRNILSEFGYDAQQGSTLKMDNQSAISVSKNPEHHGRMKHLDLHFYWLRDKVENGMICPDFIPTLEMIADCLTKSVPAAKACFCGEQMGVLA